MEKVAMRKLLEVAPIRRMSILRLSHKRVVQLIAPSYFTPIGCKIHQCIHRILSTRSIPNISQLFQLNNLCSHHGKDHMVWCYRPRMQRGRSTNYQNATPNSTIITKKIQTIKSGPCVTLPWPLFLDYTHQTIVIIANSISVKSIQIMCINKSVWYV